MPATVRLIAWTHFEPPDDVGWSTDADGGQALAEFAGRACYQSWHKPNPATATNAGYLAHILDVGHLSVLEHGTATFYLTGVSRLPHARTGPAPAPVLLAALSALRPRGQRGHGRAGPDRRRSRTSSPVRRATQASPEAYGGCWTGLEAKPPRMTAGGSGNTTAKAGTSGGSRGAAQRDRDPDRGHRKLPGVAALHRHPGPASTPTSRSAPLAIELSASPDQAGAERVRRLRDHRAGRRHRDRRQPVRAIVVNILSRFAADGGA